MSFWAATRLVAQREILAQVRGKALWITFAFFVAGLFAAAILPGVFDDDSAPEVLARLLTEPDARTALAARGWSAVDGRGAERVCDALLG